jgi:hypothetical protein
MVNGLCAYCGKPHGKSVSAVNRAVKAGLLIYCNRTCAGLAHRKEKTPEKKKEEKRLYDLNYRATSPTLKARKAAYYQRTKDPVKEAAKRKERMSQHLEYCRTPEYRAWKKNYDQQYLAQKQYGEFAESAIALRLVEQEVKERITREEIYTINGTLNKKQTRRRIYEQAHG